MSKTALAKKLPTEFKHFLNIVGDSPINPSDPESLTYRERLAQHCWQMALTGNKEAYQWANIVLNRLDGLPTAKVEVSHSVTELVDSIAARLISAGLSAGQVRSFLEAAGVEENNLQLLPYVEGEIVE